jgi:hypothetical protein
MPYSKIYVNGQLITAALCSGNGLGYRLAGDAINSGAPGQLGFNGSIDEIRAYNRELSASEVQAIYDCEGP